MSQPELRTRRQLVQDSIRYLVTYTSLLAWFGVNSVGYAIAQLTGAQHARGYLLYRALIRRVTLLASEGDYATQVAEEHGARRFGPQRSRVFVGIVPRNAIVTDIALGVTDLIEVDDATEFTVGRELRIRSEDASVTETATILSVSVGTGPNGGTQLEVASLANVYAFLTEDVRVLLRHTIPIDSVITTSTGVTFQTLETVTTSDANAVMDSESTFLGLLDKVFCECTTRGAAGNIGPESVIDFAPAVPEVLRIFNPERAFGGGDIEPEFDLKYRASNVPAVSSLETPAWVEALASRGNSNALRTLVTSTTVAGVLPLKVLHRNGGALSASEKQQLTTYLQDRVRSLLTITIADVTLTSVEVEATITLDPDADFRSVWQDASNRLAAYLDYRRWPFGADVDEADLLTIVNQTPGVATLTVASFLPSSAVVVGPESLPHLTRVTLTNGTTGDVLGADILMAF